MADRYSTLVTISTGVDKRSVKKASDDISNFVDGMQKQIKEAEKEARKIDITSDLSDELKTVKKELEDTKKSIKKDLKDLAKGSVTQKDFDIYTKSISQRMEEMQKQIDESVASINKSLNTISADKMSSDFLYQINKVKTAMKEFGEVAQTVQSSFGDSFSKLKFSDTPMSARLTKIKSDVEETDKKLGEMYDDFEKAPEDILPSGNVKKKQSEIDSLVESYKKLSDEMNNVKNQASDTSDTDKKILLEQTLLQIEKERELIANKLLLIQQVMSYNDKYKDISFNIDMDAMEEDTDIFADEFEKRLNKLSKLVTKFSNEEAKAIKNVDTADVNMFKVRDGVIKVPLELDYSYDEFKKKIHSLIQDLVVDTKKFASKDNNKIRLEFEDLDKDIESRLSSLQSKYKLNITTNLDDEKNGLFANVKKAVKKIKEIIKDVPIEIGTITVSDKALESAGRRIIDAVLPAKDLSKAVSEYSKAIDKISNFGKTEKFNFADLLTESVIKTITSIDTLLDRIPQIANELKEVKNAFPDTSKTDGVYATKEDVNNLLALTKQLNDIKVAINELNNRKINIGINPKGFSSIVDELKEVERVMARAFNVKNIDELESDLRQSLKLLDQVKTKQGELSKRGYKQYVPFFEEYDKYIKNGGDKSFADMSWLDNSDNEIKFTAEQLEILNNKYAEYVKYVKEANKETSVDTTDDFTNKQIDNLERLNKIAKDIYDDLQGKTIKLDFDTEEIDKFRNAILELKEVLSKAFNVKTESELNKSLVNSLSLLDKVKTKSGELSKRGYKQYIPFFEEYDKYKNAGGNKEFSDISWSGKDGNTIKFTAEQLEVLNKQYAEYNKHKKESVDSKLDADNNITQEINKINELNQSLEVVKTTIKEKNELFENEADIVSGVAKREVDDLKPLKTTLGSISGYLDKINKNSKIDLSITTQGDFDKLNASINNVVESVDNKNASIIAEKNIVNKTVPEEVDKFKDLASVLENVESSMKTIKEKSKVKVDAGVKQSSKSSKDSDNKSSNDEVKKTVDSIKFLKRHLKDYFAIKSKINSGDSLSKEEQSIWNSISSGISKATSRIGEFSNQNEKVVNALRDFDIAYNKTLSTINEKNIGGELKDGTKAVKEFYSAVNKLLTLGGNSDVRSINNIIDEITNKVKELKRYSNVDLSEIDANLNSKMRSDFLNRVGKNVNKYSENVNSGRYVNSNKFEEYIKWVNILESKLPINFTDEESIKEIDKVIVKLREAEKELNNLNNIKVDGNNLYRFQSQVAKFMQDNSKAVKKYSVDFEKIRETMKNVNSDADLSNLMAQFGRLEAKIRLAGDTGKTAFDKLRERIKSVGATLVSYVSVFDLVMYAREIASAVTEVDTALTELVKVSDMSNARLQQSFEKSRDTAKELGATLSDTIQATADWSRLGYDPDQAEELGKIALLYKNVGDNIDIETANQSLISTLQGFQLQAEQAESIVDKFNEVANNYAIDSGGIGQALQRSAASFNAANTSLSESIALVTATKLHWLCIW